MNLTRIDTIVQFTQGSATAWSNANVPVPAGAVVIDTVNKIIKEGDGVTLFANLPVCLDYNFSLGTSGAVTPVGDDEGMIAIAANSVYSPSTTKLADLLAMLTTLAARSTAQQVTIDTLNAGNKVFSVSQGTIDGTIVVCKNGMYTPGTETLTQLISDIIASANIVGTSMHIIDLVWYTDSGLTQLVATQNDITENGTYYCQITGWHDTAELRTIDFGLTTAQAGITITPKVVTPVTHLLTAIYASNGADVFIATAIDSLGNLVAVGSSTVSVGAQPKALAVKFDGTFTALARVLYSGNFSETFQSVVIDGSNNIVCVGSYVAVSGGPTDAFIVKFDSTLSNIITHKTYGGSGEEVFYDVAIDPAGDFIAVGYTTTEGSGSKDALIVRFDSNLNVLSRKRYGGSNDDVLIGVVVSAAGNAICVGSTQSEGVNGSALILKLDSNLNIVLRKVYNSTLGTTTEFAAVAITAANVICCVGRIIMATGNKALVATFDANLNITGDIIYGGTNGNTEFTGVIEDSLGNIVAAGKTNCEGGGDYDAIVLKLSPALATISRKTYGTVGADIDLGVTVDGSDNIILCGYGLINGSTDAIITKLPSTLPAGTYTNKVFTDMILTDSVLTASLDSATVHNSVLAIADSTLTLGNGSMLLTNATGGVLSDITIMDATSNVFKVVVGKIVATGDRITPTFTVSANDGKVATSKNINVNIWTSKLITSIYGGTSDEQYNAVAIDLLGNIICVGWTMSEGTGAKDCLIVKYDTNLNIVLRKTYGGTADDQFYGVDTDSQNNIIVVGETFSEMIVNGSPTYSDGLVVKFDTNLNILARKVYGGSVNEWFFGVAVDSADNIAVVGYTWSEGLGDYNALVLKFNPSLAIITRKVYSGSNSEWFYGVAVDGLDNIICVGQTNSEGSGYIDALIVKFDSTLAILGRKTYGGGGQDEWFQAVAIDPVNNIICVGETRSSGGGSGDALIVKFDKNLTLVASKIYNTGSEEDIFMGVVVDLMGNIAAVGYAGPNFSVGIITKFDSSLNLTFAKSYGGPANDYLTGVTVDPLGNVVCVGGTSTVGAGGTDAIALKIPATLGGGTFVGQVLTTMVMADSGVTLGSPSATLAASNLMINTSTLTLADSSLTLANSSLSTLRESIGF